MYCPILDRMQSRLYFPHLFPSIALSKGLPNQCAVKGAITQCVKFPSDHAAVNAFIGNYLVAVYPMCHLSNRRRANAPFPVALVVAQGLAEDHIAHGKRTQVESFDRKSDAVAFIRRRDRIDEG